MKKTLGYAGTRRKTGAMIGVVGEIVNVNLKCAACDAEQSEPLDADAPIKASIEGCTCVWCGRVGQMRLCRKGAA